MSIVEKVHYLDRKVTNTTLGVTSTYDSFGTVGIPWTTWTLPYSVATDGTEGTVVVCRVSAPYEYPTTRPSATEVRVEGYGDLTSEDVYIGILYDFEFTFGAPYLRDRDGRAEAQGYLTIRKIEALLEDSTDLEALVKVEGSADAIYPFGRTYPSTDEGLTAFVQSLNHRATITLRNKRPGGVYITGLDWEATYTRRSRRT